ncbi:hypothetical protein AMQ83_05490, partial [Paenibacillus riograndensis]
IRKLTECIWFFVTSEVCKSNAQESLGYGDVYKLQLGNQILPTFWSTCASLFDELDKEEQAVFQKVLGKLNASLEKRLGSGR